MSQTVLEVNGLTKNYGSLRAVDALDFSVEKGMVFGVLGPNGSGKSTTLGILTKVINADAGTFSWFGRAERENVTGEIGTLLERPNFYGYMNAVDNLRIVAEIRGVSAALIPDVLKFVKLYQRRNSRYKTFSFGMQQRLAIASALLGDPEVLILDEPTNGLDPEGIAEIREMILEIAHGGKTIILASHLLDEVQKVCSSILILKKGRKIYSGDIHGLNTGTTVIKMKAADTPKLRQVLETYPNVTSVNNENEYVNALVDKDTDPAELNAYLMEYGVRLSHLSLVTQNLESQFLELLKNDAQ